MNEFYRDGRKVQQGTPIIIRDMLKAGFGVEDIHVKTGIHIEHIRFVVRGLRHSGELARMFGVEVREV